jgi:purine-binding chemotaxis protein CheW
VRQLCTFRLSDYHLGIDVECVREVIRHRRPAPVPLAPPGVVGLINIRGQITTVVDLRARLGRSAAPPRDDSVGVVLQGPGRVVSLLVDVVGEVLTVDEATFEPPPETVREPARSLLVGTYNLPEGLVLVLDTEKAVPKYEESAL